MGTYNSQIATGIDLYNIGYNLPYSYQISEKGITYKNLKDIDEDTSCNITNCSFNYSHYKQHGSTVLTDFTQNIPITRTTESFYCNSTTVVEKHIFKFTAPSATQTLIKKIDGVATISFYNTSTNRYAGELLMGIGLSIGNNASPEESIIDPVYESVYEWDAGNGVAQGYKFKTITRSITIDGTIDFNDTVDKTYYIILYCKLSKNNTNVRVTFEISSQNTEPYLNLYSENKCVPWNCIKGSNGQNPSDPDTVKKTIICRLYDQTSGTKVDTVKFYYCYQLNGQTTINKIEVGKDTLSGISPLTATCNVLINPKVNGTIIKEYLSVWIGTATIKQSWKYQLNSSHPPYDAYWKEIDGTWKEIELNLTEKLGKQNYNDTLLYLNSVLFRIN